MDEVFYLFNEYRDEGTKAKHYICGDYHLWVWMDDANAVVKFEFHYKDKSVKFSGGEFSRGSDNYVMPMFFLLDQLFTCDADMQARLLAVRDAYVPMAVTLSRGDSLEELSPLSA